MSFLKPLHNILLILSTLFFIVAFSTLKKTLDIHVGEVTYVIAFAKIFMASAVFLSLIWLLYTFTAHQIFSKKVYSFHIFSTVFLFIFISVGALWSHQWIEAYAGNDMLKSNTLTIEIGRLLVVACITLLVVQLLYPLNLIIGIFTNKKH